MGERVGLSVCRSHPKKFCCEEKALEDKKEMGSDEDEYVAKFHLEKQCEGYDDQLGRPAVYLTNPEGTEDIILADADGSAGQLWHWSKEMLVCDTGKALDISADGVVANAVHGGDSQKLYLFKHVSRIDGTVYMLIGPHSEKNERFDKSFLLVPKGEGKAVIKEIDPYILEAAEKGYSSAIKNDGREFVYREIYTSEPKETEDKFHLEKQCEGFEDQPGRPAVYLTNPEGTEDVILADADGSAGQVWHWSKDMLICDTGKVLDVSADGVVATAVHGGDSQKFYHFKHNSAVDGKEYVFIGPLSEKNEEGEKTFLSVPADEGKAIIKLADPWILEALGKGLSSIITGGQLGWEFAYRRIYEVKESAGEK